MSDDQDRLAAGRAIQAQLWGEAAGSGRLPPLPAAEIAPDFFPIVTTFCFGMFWDRPGLALRDRSLATVSMLAALGRQDELRAHLMGARNLGISKEELVEVLMQVAVYAGVPIALAALNTAAQVLADPKSE
jgi:4-carboxymuconolactone decarboxylase